MDSTPKYWAFISYSHADERVAKWLHQALETYRLPRRLVGGAVPSRLFPVFRDRADLATAETLGDKIEEALRASRNLIVIASRVSANSVWVNEEVRRFKALGRESKVFTVIIDGEPFSEPAGRPGQECLAPALRFHVGRDGKISTQPAEPIAADIRHGKSSRKDALLMLIAGMLDLGLDELRQRDVRRHRRNMTAIAVASLTVAAVTTVLAWTATQARIEAQARRGQAEHLIHFMLGELRGKLEPIGKLDVLDVVGEQAIHYFGTVNSSQLSDGELAAQAKALRQIGDVRVKQGDLNRAAEAFRQALKLDQEQLARRPDDQQALFNIGQSQFYVGYDLYLRKDLTAAAPWFHEYAVTAEQLVDMAPDNPAWQLEVVYAQANLSTIASETGDVQEAKAGIERTLMAYQQLMATGTDKAAYQQGMAESLSGLAIIAMSENRWQDAVDFGARQEKVLSEIEADAIGAPQRSYKLATALHHQARGLLELNALPPGHAVLGRLTQLTAEMAQRDRGNVEYQRAHMLSLMYLSRATDQQGEPKRALEIAQQAESVLNLEGVGEVPASTVRAVVINRITMGELNFALGDKPAANRWARRALERLPSVQDLTRAALREWADTAVSLAALQRVAGDAVDVPEQLSQWTVRVRGSDVPLTPLSRYLLAVLAADRSGSDAAFEALSAGSRAESYVAALQASQPKQLAGQE